ncbi:MAG: hypothetical protein JWO80_717 [Bryobacterales bacterium]|nr:hypothetical protein [Bryobacterales bacterium]
MPIADLLAESLTLWRECATTFTAPGREYTPAEQSANEAHLAQSGEALRTHIPRPDASDADREKSHAFIASAFVRFARSALSLEDRHATLLLDGGFARIGPALDKQARRFDPQITDADILQACRNAWTACGLQSLYGQPMDLTPAIFAYSMLYPYSDNYLDDPSLSGDDKLAFRRNFRRRLSGEPVPATNSCEEAAWRLVALIESQYTRAEHPRIFESLLDIHHAQEQSLRLVRGCLDPLPLLFAKGGASVLADAYLAAGSLSACEARFAFIWGVLLQLGDDLQDVAEDLEGGAMTLFTEAAGRGTLDELTNRTFHFARRAMTIMEQLDSRETSLKELIERSSFSLLIRAAGKNRERYSESYIATLQSYSPLLFDSAVGPRTLAAVFPNLRGAE